MRLLLSVFNYALTTSLVYFLIFEKLENTFYED